MMTPLTTFYRNRLPHLTPVGGTFFITFRIKDAVPIGCLQRLRQQYYETIGALDRGRLTDDAYRKQLFQARHRYFRGYDEQLDTGQGSCCYFTDPSVCKIMLNHLYAQDGLLYELKAFCIMPNHVHLLISLANQLTDPKGYLLDEHQLQISYRPLSEIMRQLKGASAREINQHLGRRDSFWQKDSYDHYVRNERAYRNILYYILHNPVKAGLVQDWREYPYTYCV